MFYLPIAYQSFWRDEAFSALIAIHQPLQIIHLMIGDQSPPLYFLLLHYWIEYMGTSELAIRTLSLWFFVGTILMSFLVSWEVLRTIPGRIAITLALLFNPFLIQYAYEARPYSMLAFLISVSAYFILKRWFFFASTFLSLALLTHNFSYFFLAAIGLWFLYTYKENLLNEWKKFLLLFGLPTLSILVWGGAVLQQFARVGTQFWITEKTSAMFWYLFTSFASGSIWYKDHDILLFFSVMLLVMGMAPLVSAKEKRSSAVLLCLSLALLPILFTYVISVWKTPIYYDRYLIASLPFLALAVAYGVESLMLQNSVIEKSLLLCLLCGYFLILNNAAVEVLQSATKPAINWAVGQALLKAKPGDSIVSESDLNFLETKWYVRGNEKHIHAYTYSPTGTIPYYIGSAAIDKSDVITALPTHKTVWIIQQNGGYHKEVVK